MRNHIVNVGSRVCTGKNQTNFSDTAMHNICSILFELIRVNGQSYDVSVSNKFFSISSGKSIVKFTESVNALFSVFKHCVPEDIVWSIVLMFPNKWNSRFVVIFKCISPNRSTVSAFQVVSSRPSAKIEFISHLFLLKYLLIIARIVLVIFKRALIFATNSLSILRISLVFCVRC